MIKLQIVSTVVVLALIAIGTISCTHNLLKNTREQKRCETLRRLPSMGSFFEVQIAHDCAKPLNADLFINTQKQLDTLESELSLYQTQSAISKLNRTGRVAGVSDDFIQLLELSKEFYVKTNGIFNITIQAYFQNMKISPEKKFSRTRLNMDNVRWEKKKSAWQVQFLVPQMQITFDGIAKGYAVDRIAEKLEQLGIQDYLINFSGNMRWSGRRQDGGLWQIAVWHPRDQKIINLPAQIRGAIATSGNEHQSKHLIDPRTLEPIEAPLSVTAIGPSAAICDILSTTFYVQKQSEREELIRKLGRQYQAIELF